MNRERALTELVAKLNKSYGEALVSVVLYGSGASGETTRYSDLNVLCVLRRITVDELRLSEEIVRWWRELGNPAPLLLDENEVRDSTDCFPIEFHDIKERHNILHGADLFSTLPINDVFYRAEVEYELRAKLLRLRQKAAGLLSDRELLLRLMVDSASTFGVLMRHALRISGEDAPWPKREVIARCAQKFDIDGEPFLRLLDLREERIRPRDVQATELFSHYLEGLGKLVKAVDRLDR